MSAEPMGADPEGRASSPHLRPATHRMDAISARDQRMDILPSWMLAENAQHERRGR